MNESERGHAFLYISLSTRTIIYLRYPRTISAHTHTPSSAFVGSVTTQIFLLSTLSQPLIDYFIQVYWRLTNVYNGRFDSLVQGLGIFLWGYGTEIEHVIIVCALLSRCFPAGVADV